MNDEVKPNNVVEKGKAAIDCGVDDPSSEEMDRLVLARRQAIDSLTLNATKASKMRISFWPLTQWGASAISAVLLVVLAVNYYSGDREIENNPPVLATLDADLEEIEVIMSDEDLDMFEHELEFYSWVESEVSGT